MAARGFGSILLLLSLVPLITVNALPPDRGAVTITDLTHLVRYLFLGAPEPAIRPSWTQ